MKIPAELLVEQLPDDVRWRAQHLSMGDRVEIDRLLKETGVENFSQHWREHKAELEHIKNF